MNILYVSQYFPPEKCAPAARVSELARELKKRGHFVTVLTGFPNHPTGVVPQEYRKRLRRLRCREKWDGIDIVRTWLWPVSNKGILGRALCFVSFFLSACVSGPLCARPEVVIATSPQILVGLTGWFLAKCFGVPFVFEVRDLWPESMEAVGASGCRDFLYRSVGWVAGFLYRYCRHIVVVSPAFRDELIANWKVDANKLDVVENGVDPEMFSPTGPDDLRRPLGLMGKFTVSYIGTIGMAHGLDTVLDAAELVREQCPGAHFLVIGDGAEKHDVARHAAERGMRNVSFLPSQPHETVPALIRASDVCLVPLRKRNAFRSVIPSKMLEFMACGRAVILGVEGQAAQILRDAEAGICVSPENPAELAKAIGVLYRDSHLRGRMGANGRACVLARYTRASTAARYVAILQSVIDQFRINRGLHSEEAGIQRSTNEALPILKMTRIN